MKVVVVTVYFPHTGQQNISVFTTMEKATRVMEVLGMNGAAFSWAIVEVDKMGDWDLR